MAPISPVLHQGVTMAKSGRKRQHKHFSKAINTVQILLPNFERSLMLLLRQLPDQVIISCCSLLSKLQLSQAQDPRAWLQAMRVQ